MSKGIFERFADALLKRVTRRLPDETIGHRGRPFLWRWHLLPKNRLCNLYLHGFVRSDEDRALHDHPWPNVTLVLKRSYIEETIRAGGIHVRRERRAGCIRARWPWTAHRIELTGGAAWTLFLTGPKCRSWGFHCPDGWVHWRDFTGGDRGCG